MTSWTAQNYNGFDCAGPLGLSDGYLYHTAPSGEFLKGLTNSGIHSRNMPSSCLGHIRQGRVGSLTLGRPHMGMFLFGPELCYWVFQYHCVCADAPISNQFWNTGPLSMWSHYRRPMGSLRPPDWVTPKNGHLPCLNTPWRCCGCSLYQCVLIAYNIPNLKAVCIQQYNLC